jgi:hypothetical protein
VFAVFDLIWLNGRDMRDLTLLERKEILRYQLKTPSAESYSSITSKAEGSCTNRSARCIWKGSSVRLCSVRTELFEAFRAKRHRLDAGRALPFTISTMPP